METETFKIFGLIYSYSVPFSFFFSVVNIKDLGQNPCTRFQFSDLFSLYQRLPLYRKLLETGVK